MTSMERLVPSVPSVARQPSLDDMNLDQFLKISNYEDTVKQLDIYYGIVKRQLLQFQSPITGLFPVLSTDREVGSIRDSVYCAASIWSLYQAYRRIDDDRGKSYELGQSAVKCMRGVLECWIKQAHRVEKFKSRQCAVNALHCKFHLDTGEEIYSDERYNHLQIDVVSIYLIFLVQMISSGLQIIYTQDEVAFVQNLVYYVERAYRTPDYGMWERGSKYNDGTPEIHASSIGMAKSALEAINGCNLFGEKGASWSVVYVDIDAHNRNRSIFETMLPRESSSKGVDASLIPTLSFPAFASHEDRLVEMTKANVIMRLKGKKGFKRFSRDGYLSRLEDKTRRYYHKGEIKEFDGFECEWPMFYTYMIIDGVFKNNLEQIEEYQMELRKCMHSDQNGDPVVSMCYAPDGDGMYTRASSQALFLWGQSVFIIAQLLTAGLLHINELDPIRRYLPSYNRPRKGGRYSAFQALAVMHRPLVLSKAIDGEATTNDQHHQHQQHHVDHHSHSRKDSEVEQDQQSVVSDVSEKRGTATDLVVQIVLITESMRLQAMMATYGIQTQTPNEVEPVQIWSSTQLINVYQQLGVNEKLGLTGRPSRPVGSLGTSKVYRICGMTVLCYPLIFEVSDFYLYRDMALLIDDIKTELQFVGKYWRLSGRPTVCLLIREEHMRDPQFKEMIDLLAMLKKGYCDGMKVRIGRLQNLISSSCIEHLDFMSHMDLPDPSESSFAQIHHDYIGYQSLTDVPRAQSYREKKISAAEYQTKSTADIVEGLRNTESIFLQSQLLGILLHREGANYEIAGDTVHARLTELYCRAGTLRYWRAVRYCSSLLRHIVDSISPFITTVLVNGKQITVGVLGQRETVFDKPMTPEEIQNVMYSTVQPYNVIYAVLQQEVVLYCGRLIATNPDIFKGILKIRVGWVLEAMRLYLVMTGNEGTDIENLSPFHIRKLLQRVLTASEYTSEDSGFSALQRRQLEGCLFRVPHSFYNHVWDVLERTPLGITVQGHTLPATTTLSNKSRSEFSFALQVEEMLYKIDEPERRQIVVELLCIVATILRRNPELRFNQILDLDFLLEDSFAMYCKDHGLPATKDISPLFSLSQIQTTGYLARAAVNSVLMRCALASDIFAEDVEDHCRVQ
ncbi:probable phosphorylase b kinase regulatory subunit beta isoform X3 [Topomyia yanbarensis]|uniref:probable phosphorylase b kinase regulatory subunit beta isoform X3 n=1 Tax=Topomyia yanbarensis TaxID=2498891 RepID=UPI00273B6E5F|nr:probable phosphorylase b kinase regulatory subunit beta isoform X3 [Topomyia yanbarensis]XP_058821890.1 probable phosphorylase b kinase regulatory subunit beta isoform X3 [Topomyia yanbarensis]